MINATKITAIAYCLSLPIINKVVKYMYNDSDSEEIMQRLAYASQNASVCPVQMKNTAPQLDQWQ